MPDAQIVANLNSLLRQVRIAGAEQLHSRNDAEQRKAEEDVSKAVSTFSTSIDGFLKDADNQLPEAVALKREFDAYVKISDRMTSLFRAHKEDEAVEVFFGDLANSYAHAGDLADKLIEIHQREATASTNITTLSTITHGGFRSFALALCSPRRFRQPFTAGSVSRARSRGSKAR